MVSPATGRQLRLIFEVVLHNLTRLLVAPTIDERYVSLRDTADRDQRAKINDLEAAGGGVKKG
jgi:hypothetical protein